MSWNWSKIGLRGAVKKTNSIFTDIVQIGGRKVNPISKKLKRYDFFTKFFRTQNFFGPKKSFLEHTLFCQIFLDPEIFEHKTLWTNFFDPKLIFRATSFLGKNFFFKPKVYGDPKLILTLFLTHNFVFDQLPKLSTLQKSYLILTCINITTKQNQFKWFLTQYKVT